MTVDFMQRSGLVFSSGTIVLRKRSPFILTESLMFSANDIMQTDFQQETSLDVIQWGGSTIDMPRLQTGSLVSRIGGNNFGIFLHNRTVGLTRRRIVFF